jgi:hypothetical protein
MTNEDEFVSLFLRSSDLAIPRHGVICLDCPAPHAPAKRAHHRRREHATRTSMVHPSRRAQGHDTQTRTDDQIDQSYLAWQVSTARQAELAILLGPRIISNIARDIFCSSNTFFVNLNRVAVSATFLVPAPPVNYCIRRLEISRNIRQRDWKLLHRLSTGRFTRGGALGLAVRCLRERRVSVCNFEWFGKHGAD